MEFITKVNDIRARLDIEQKSGKRIGFVPTMGYLHEGHLSLIRKSAAENDITVISIFVNPTQFGPGEDFTSYPRDLDRDLRMAQEAGADIAFVPDASEIYPEGFKTYVEVTEVTGTLCGASRPGHFRGVATVVTKLFNIVRPLRAYFGQKDAQQTVVIRQMVRDLNMGIDIVVCPIVREPDGLAMSSRNVRLDPEERRQAAVLFQALSLAKELIGSGEKDAVVIKADMEKKILEKTLARIDYVSIVDINTLKDTREIGNGTLIALAVKFGATRLIDNIVIEV